MNLLKVLNICMLIVTTKCCIAATEHVSHTEEGASHFTPHQNAIYQANIGPAMNRVFAAYFSPDAVKRPGAYLEAINAFANERALIAKKSGMDPETFRKDRRDLDGSLGLLHYTTPLSMDDNKILYDVMLKKFEDKKNHFGSLRTRYEYKTRTEIGRLTKENEETLSAISDKGGPSKLCDVDFLRQQYRGEIECDESLTTTADTINLFRENSELGTIVNNHNSVSVILNPDLVLATLRFSVLLNGTEPISIGSISCLALPICGGYKYYKNFALDHVRSDNIDALLAYASMHWKESISWNNVDSKPFLESMARMFWAQTIAITHVRGGESNAKSMLTLTARYHGIELCYRPDFAFRMPLAMSPEEFAEYFKENVFLRSELLEELV